MPIQNSVAHAAKQKSECLKLETLENYLSSDFISEEQEIRSIERTLEGVAAMFSVCGDKCGWRYAVKLSELDDEYIDKKSTSSIGTIAMILASVGVLTGDCQSFTGSGVGLSKIGSNDLKLLWKEHWEKLVSGLVDESEITSVTFGKNNVLTASHIYELINGLRDKNKSEQLSNAILPTVDRAVCAAFDRGVDSALADPKDAVKFTEYQKNAFVLVRAMRSKNSSDGDGRSPKQDEIKRFREYFESTLHDHLSFSSIPDSRFDPAELIFCLEGLLLCSPEAVDTTLLTRVLEVLSDKQSANSHWRANKPFMTGATGAINLPLSVEGANSLMRSVAMMDKHRHFNTYTAMALPLIARFWTWLRARSVRFENGKQSCVGWHSEHVNTPDVIHLWDTALVAEFMYSYREMLERHMADKSLHLAGLSIKRLKKSTRSWEAITADFEPMLDDEVRQQVYVDAGKDFVEGWLKKEPKNFSILLYGPPGTGKSTFAENMAAVLGFPFITVTVSDFLGSGGANVESRAKAVFKTLEMQKDCVILFDEIDSFLLDRNSKLYHGQDSLFQFLTPGMLTKINDLRKLKRSIFLIATNYEKRIDAAIKRTGRIDKKYLLGLPNAARRAKILNLPPVRLAENLRKSSVLFAFSDLDGAKRDADAKITSLGANKDTLQDGIIEELKNRTTATSVQTYLDLANKDEVFPNEELEGLLYLIQEAHDGKGAQDRPLAEVKTTGDISCLSEDLKETLKELGLEIIEGGTE